MRSMATISPDYSKKGDAPSSLFHKEMMHSSPTPNTNRKEKIMRGREHKGHKLKLYQKRKESRMAFHINIYQKQNKKLVQQN